MRELLLETKGLKTFFPTKRGMLHAVDDINIRIHKGETLGVVGESGCGKTTLGRTILRLQEPIDGEILYRGEGDAPEDADHLPGSLRFARSAYVRFSADRGAHEDPEDA